MAVIPLFRNLCPPVRRLSFREQLDGPRLDLATTSAKTRDPLAAEDLVSAARRVSPILRRMEAGV
jgi:hypothetical protein